MVWKFNRETRGTRKQDQGKQLFRVVQLVKKTALQQMNTASPLAKSTGTALLDDSNARIALRV
jgi:hypothetical protein